MRVHIIGTALIWSVISGTTVSGDQAAIVSDPASIGQNPKWQWYLDAVEKGILPAFQSKTPLPRVELDDFDLLQAQLLSSNPMVTDVQKALAWFCLKNPRDYLANVALDGSFTPSFTDEALGAYREAQEVAFKRFGVGDDDPGQFRLVKVGQLKKGDFRKLGDLPINRLTAAGRFGFDVDKDGFTVVRARKALMSLSTSLSAVKSIEKQLEPTVEQMDICGRGFADGERVVPVSASIPYVATSTLVVDLPGKSLTTFNQLDDDQVIYYSIEFLGKGINQGRYQEFYAEKSDEGVPRFNKALQHADVRGKYEITSGVGIESLPKDIWALRVTRIRVYLAPEMKAALSDYTVRENALPEYGLEMPYRAVHKPYE